MGTKRALQPQKCLYMVLFVIITSSILAACGTNSNNSSKGTVPSSPSQAPTRIEAGYGTAHGCPSDVIVNPAPAAADISVGLNRSNSVVNAHTDNVIEIRLPFGLTWEGPTTSQGVLQLQHPYGYAWNPGNVCIWRFVAKGTGTASISFFGRAICQKASLCVPSVAIAMFHIKVR